MDQARIFALERVVVELQPCLHVGPEVLDQHVGLLDHAIEDRTALVAAQVERHASLVAMLVLEIRLMAAGEIGRIARPLDAHHIGTPVGELAHADRPGARMGEIQHEEAFERARGWLIGHAGLTRP